MSQPAVNISELDGALGVLPPSAGRLYAVVGNCSSGPVDTPATYARTKLIKSTFGEGPAVEAACHFVERYGRPVVIVRTGATTPGAAGTVDDDGVAGTSVITADDTTTEPYGDFEVYFEVATGGTIGVTGITFRWSLDGGRTMSALTALGTANTYTIPSSGVTLDFAAGTLVAGDNASFRTTAPQWNSTELGTALDALKASAASWEILLVTGAVSATFFDAIDLKVEGMASAAKNRVWFGSVRMPNEGESEATYLSSLSTAFAAKSSVYGALCAGACKMTSSVSGRKYRAPVAYVAAAREASVSEEIDTADVNLGTLVGVSIRDDNGNPDEHDESENPGLDDARFYVLRTWEGIAGVYVNRPRLFSPEGSDFYLVPHRRVMNLGRDALRLYFIRRLNKPVQVNRSTGFILEQEALEIEAGARQAMASVLLAKPKASDVSFTLSRTDNLLSTKTLTGDARITPLAYPEIGDLELGFYNPALQVQAV